MGDRQVVEVIYCVMYESVYGVSFERKYRKLAEKGGSRTLREPYGSQTGFEDQRHHRAPSFSLSCELDNLAGFFAPRKRHQNRIIVFPTN